MCCRRQRLHSATRAYQKALFVRAPLAGVCSYRALPLLRPSRARPTRRTRGRCTTASCASRTTSPSSRPQSTCSPPTVASRPTAASASRSPTSTPRAGCRPGVCPTPLSASCHSEAGSEEVGSEAGAPSSRLVSVSSPPPPTPLPPASLPPPPPTPTCHPCPHTQVRRNHPQRRPLFHARDGAHDGVRRHRPADQAALPRRGRRLQRPRPGKLAEIRRDAQRPAAPSSDPDICRLLLSLHAPGRGRRSFASSSRSARGAPSSQTSPRPNRTLEAEQR